MAKTVFKEIIITLLLCIAILLILGIIFYDYNPLNKVVPSKIAYTEPDDIKNELEENEVNDVWDSGINVVYSIEGKDLNVYKKSNSYVSGKQNPFGTIAEEVTNDETNSSTTSGSSTGTKANNINKTNTNPDSTGTFLNTTGKK